MIRKSCILIFIIFITVGSVQAGDCSVILQQPIAGADGFICIDPVIDNAGALKALLFGDRPTQSLRALTLDDLADHVIDGGTLPFNMINRMGGSGDTVFVYMMALSGGYGGIAIEFVLSSELVFIDSTWRTFELFDEDCDFPLQDFYDIGFVTNRSSVLGVRCSVMMDFYTVRHLGEFFERSSFIPTTAIFDTDFDELLAREPAILMDFVHFGDVQGFVSLGDYYYYQVREVGMTDDWVPLYEYEERLWSCLNLKSADATDLYKTCSEGIWYRRLFVCDCSIQHDGEEIVVETWPSPSSAPWESHTSFASACYALDADSLTELWARPYEGLSLRYVYEPQHFIAGMRGNDMMIAVDYSTGEIVDSVSLDRGLENIKFFETASGLNLVGRVHDTIFVYQFDTPTGIEERPDPELPTTFYLYQNYPNPFNPETTVEFELPRRCHATLRVYNILGQEITTLLDRDLPAGTHTASWEGRGEASGVYFYRLSAGDWSETKKMVLLK